MCYLSIFAGMTVFDQFFFSVFNHYKVKFKQKANTIAIGYTSILQISLLFLLGAFFTVFSLQMNLSTMSKEKTWSLFILIAIGVHFKNWLKYNGKGRKVLNAKMNKKKSPSHNIRLLFVLPVASIALGLIILQAL